MYGIDGRGGSWNNYPRRAEAGATGFGVEQAGVGNPGIVALDGDVQAVFESQLDGILEADLELAIMDELVDARRIRKHGWIDVNRLVRSKNVWKGTRGVREIVTSNA